MEVILYESRSDLQRLLLQTAPRTTTNTDTKAQDSNTIWRHTNTKTKRLGHKEKLKCLIHITF